MLMREDFLHFIWRYGLFIRANLTCTNSKSLNILEVGQLNSHSGPDFFSAKIQLDDILWVGNVEIHTKSSDWNKHHHQFDKAYNSVILHVVWEDDNPCFNERDEAVPTLVLKNLIDPNLLDNYELLLNNLQQLPCENYWTEIPSIHIDNWLERLAIERFQSKSFQVEQLFRQANKHTNQVFFELIARNYGFHLNSLPMEMLARSTPFLLLQKNKNERIKIEALLFGQAGFLNKNFKDDYPKQLKSEYQFLKQKHQLKEIDTSMWKFMRLRPLNFPTIRIAQLAALVNSLPNILNLINENLTVVDWKKLLKSEPSVYWNDHFNFDSKSKMQSKKMGDNSSENILLNGIITFLMAFGYHIDDNKLIEKALLLLNELKGEDNIFTRAFGDTKFKIENALQSQGLRHLNEFYCKPKKCVNCNIGIHLIKNIQKL